MKNKYSVSIDVNNDLLKKIKIYCINNEISFKEFVTTAILEKATQVNIIKNPKSIENYKSC